MMIANRGTSTWSAEFNDRFHYGVRAYFHYGVTTQRNAQP